MIYTQIDSWTRQCVSSIDFRERDVGNFSLTDYLDWRVSGCTVITRRKFINGSSLNLG